MPKLVVSRMTKALRPGKVLVDWSPEPSGEDDHLAVLAARPRPPDSGGPAWDEVEAGGLTQLEYDDVLARLDADAGSSPRCSRPAPASPPRRALRLAGMTSTRPEQSEIALPPSAPHPQADPEAARRTYELDRAHVFHSWSAQAALDPLVIAGAEGSWVWDGDGKPYLDFSGQLVFTNLGFGHPRSSKRSRSRPRCSPPSPRSTPTLRAPRRPG